jgi:hypothetical protein
MMSFIFSVLLSIPIVLLFSVPCGREWLDAGVGRGHHGDVLQVLPSGGLPVRPRGGGGGRGGEEERGVRA